MLDIFEVIGNKKASIELQILQLMRIYNVFYSNLIQKVSIDSLFYLINESLAL